MNRQLSAHDTTLNNLKKEAKRWLKSLRANDPEARERLLRAFPNAPAQPTLRDVQRALALEHGLEAWTALKTQLQAGALESSRKAELADLLLENACADPVLAGGPAAHAGRSRAALRILTHAPGIAFHSIHTAVVCGDLELVKRILKERPEAATEPGGPLRRREVRQREKLWTPLLHLCYGRLPTPAAGDNAVAIARLLLDNGADPNDHFEVGSPQNRYTALCGVAGEGEDDAPPHPQREALMELLLDRGAEPYDIQLFYNMHFHGDILWMMQLIYEAALRAGRQADWNDPNWSMINMGGLGFGARYFLNIAVTNNDLELAEWLLNHGASPNADPPRHSKGSRRTLYQEAMRRGFTAPRLTAPRLTMMSELLERFGATPSAPEPLAGEHAFTAACLRLDHESVSSYVAEHPEYLRSPAAMFEAVSQDRVDVVECLIDLGVSIEIEDEHKQRPLHVAASSDSLRVAAFLIERGAEIDPVESNWGATPLGFANYGQKTAMIELLGRASSNIWELTSAGQIERLRELLTAQPELANVGEDTNTPLMWLPDDEVRAIEIVKLLLRHGADPAIRNKEGKSAADCAERRGLYAAAELLRLRAK
jgi:hypothetical protein